MPDLVRGGDHLDPGRGRQLALGEQPADVVVEDLRGGAGDRAEPGSLASISHSRIDSPVRDAPLTTSIGLNACTCMSGTRRFTSRAMSKYAVPGRSGWMPPCMQTSVAPSAHASSARSTDLVQRERVGVGVGAALRERAEPAAGVADVGEVDVAVHDVGDRRRRPRRGAGRRPARRPRPAPAPSRAAERARRSSESPAGSRSALRSAASTSASSALHRRRRRCARRPAFAHRLPVAVDAVEVLPPVAGAALGVDRGVQVDAAGGTVQASSGSCHGSPTGIAPVARQPGHRVGQRGDVRQHPRVEPRLAGLHVARVDRQPLDQREARLARCARPARRSAATGARG